MELKRAIIHGLSQLAGLLIVPYGIETKLKKEIISAVESLLIVPYGIETTKRL